jgi:hypothetical protein
LLLPILHDQETFLPPAIDSSVDDIDILTSFSRDTFEFRLRAALKTFGCIFGSPWFIKTEENLSEDKSSR